MAKKRKSGYTEPDDYFPLEVRRALKLGEFAEDEDDEEKKDPYREQSKRLIEKQKKKK